MLVDIGVNLTNDRFADDAREVLDRARDAGVAQMVLTGTDLSHSIAAQRLCESLDPAGTSLFSTAGLHPHDAVHWNADTERELVTLLNHPRVRAVGECGLDFNRDFSPRSAQEHAFEAQLALAAARGLPVFVHERDASRRLLEILRSYRDRLAAVVVHCFTGDQAALFAYLDLDLHVGITGWICDERRGIHLRDLVRDIPAGRLMIETDAPYLTPRSFRPKPKGGRNEPALLVHIAEQIASCRGESLDTLSRHTSGTARRFFALPAPVNPA